MLANQNTIINFHPGGSFFKIKNQTFRLPKLVGLGLLVPSSQNVVSFRSCQKKEKDVQSQRCFAMDVCYSIPLVVLEATLHPVELDPSQKKKVKILFARDIVLLLSIILPVGSTRCGHVIPRTLELHGTA